MKKRRRKVRVHTVCSRPLKEHMIAKGIPVDKMAEDLHIHRDSIYAYRRGDRIPRLDTAVEMADYLGITVDALCGR